MGESGTLRLENLTDLIIKNESKTEIDMFGDWTSTLEKRGFKPMIECFIDAIITEDRMDIRQESIFLSHQLCAQMIVEHQKRFL